MTHNAIMDIVANLRQYELDMFNKAAALAMPAEGDTLVFPKDQPIYIQMMIYRLDDEVKDGRLTAIHRSEINDDDECCTLKGPQPQFIFDFVDGNGKTFSERASQAVVGVLSFVTEKLDCGELKADNDIKTLLANYNKLNETEKLFLSEIVGDEEWVKTHAKQLPTIFDGRFAPSGDRWNNACFAKTQRLIQEKLVKGTKWEK